MVRRRLRLYPYHTFLVIPFIVLFLYVSNVGQTRPFMTYRVLFIGTIVTLALYGIFYWLFRDRLKTGVFLSIMLFILFQYGVLYDGLERMYYAGYWPFKNIHRYLLAIYAVLLSIMFFYFRRTSRDLLRVNYFLNFLLILLIGFNLVRLAMHPAKGDLESQTINDDPTPQFSENAARPNIYYIILDGYASTQTLETDYQFANREFLSILKSKGFMMPEQAFSNYYYTSQSLSATLNMDYLQPGEQANANLRNNLVFHTLKKNGYRLYSMYSGYAVTSSFTDCDSIIYIDAPKEFEKSILRYTILRLDDLVGYFAYKRLKSQFEKMHEFVKFNATPKFCFMHFVAPHPPFVFDKEGKIRTRHNFAEHSWEPKEYYVDQLEYVNKQISTLIGEIVSGDPDAVIILQSDHGPWITAGSKEEVFSARAGILYAMRAKGMTLPRSSSSVNTFRYLFNGRFGCRLDTLEDKYAGMSELMKDPILLKKAR
jgi:hypothetical protein